MRVASRPEGQSASRVSPSRKLGHPRPASRPSHSVPRLCWRVAPLSRTGRAGLAPHLGQVGTDRRTGRSMPAADRGPTPEFHGLSPAPPGPASRRGHGRADGHLLNIGALGAGRLGAVIAPTNADVLGQRLGEARLADAGVDDAGLSARNSTWPALAPSRRRRRPWSPNRASGWASGRAGQHLTSRRPRPSCRGWRCSARSSSRRHDLLGEILGTDDVGPGRLASSALGPRATAHAPTCRCRWHRPRRAPSGRRGADRCRVHRDLDVSSNFACAGLHQLDRFVEAVGLLAVDASTTFL